MAVIERFIQPATLYRYRSLEKFDREIVIGHVIPDPDWMLVFGQNRAI